MSSTIGSWVKSTYSDGEGACVEWAPTQMTTSAVPVRDSKTPEGARLNPSAHAWQTFVNSLKV
ncbi:DUF397 domain-containing protein [Streptomyces sp. NPDC050504]|uniref:DUF397 domain-containing protein n=1 Tax=Streptomyces sp. NPDC050504 TaxID=3365618 RepID=UPI003792B6D8